MRDIRSDLQERANLIEEEITAAIAHFEKTVEQLQSECDARVAKLRAELAVLGVLIESEHQRMPNSGPRPIETEHQRTPNGPRPVALPRQTLADFLARKLAQAGARSQDELSRLAAQEGYFPDAERASPAVHATLVDLLRGDRIRQLPDGTLAPAPLSQMIRRQTV
jgi:translation initiation factor 2 beta subunit (eIF-2beta)/eIF-5